MESNKAFAPGAGTYDIGVGIKQASPRYGFGTSKRADLGRKNDAPGPGTYRLPTTVGDVPAYSMPNRSDESKYV